MAGVKSQAPYFHRVQKRIARPALPKGQYVGSTFVDTDGTEYTVSSGVLDGPMWPEGLESASDAAVPARVHLPRPK